MFRNKSQTIFNILLSLILIISIIQILPNEVKVIRKVSASTTWYQGNWSAPENYSIARRVDIMPDSGDLKLHFGQLIYVVDNGNNRIIRTMVDGTGWSTFGTFGSGKGQFGSPKGIWYDINSGYLYIVDAQNCRIVKTKFNGAGWTTYGSYGNGTGQFDLPHDLYYESSTGFIYIADAYNHRIVKTKLNGSGWTTYGSYGTVAKGTFQQPTGIYYNNFTDHIYVVDAVVSKLVKTKIEGTDWTTFYGPGNGTYFHNPIQVFHDNNTDYLYITDNTNCQIVKTKMDGSGWTTYGSAGKGKGQFQHTRGLFFDQNTNLIYIADMSNNRIVTTMINGSGWKTLYKPKHKGDRFSNPWDVALAEMGYCSDGYMKSNEFHFGGPADILSLSWVADVPNNTSVKFQIKSATDQEGLKSANFVGPGGNASRFYNTSVASVWSGHCGDRWMQYKAILSTNDVYTTPTLKDVTLVYNLLPNSPIIIKPADNFQTNNNVTSYSWIHNDTDSNGQIGYQWQMDDNKKFESIDYDGNKTSSSQSTYTPPQSITDGIWYWRIRTQDTDGGWGAFSKRRKILIDTQNPISEITIPKNNSYFSVLNNITGRATDPGVCSGINKTEVFIKRLEDDLYWDGDLWVDGESWNLVLGHERWWYNTSKILWTSGSTYLVRSRSRDNVTNVEIPSNGNIFGFDTEDPISYIEFPKDNSSCNKVSTITGASIDFGGSGIKHVEITIKKISNNRYWNGKSWKDKKTWLRTKGTNSWTYNAKKVPWASGKEYLISSRATDIVDNIEKPTNGNIFQYDDERPSSNIEFPKDNSYLNQVEYVYGNAIDIGGSSIKKVEIIITKIKDGKYWNGDVWDLEKQWIIADGSNEWIYNTNEVKWVSEKYYTVTSRATDNAKNKEDTGDSVSFMFDNTHPEQTFSINDDSKFTNNRTVELSLDFWDSGSGVSEMSFKSDGDNWTIWEPCEFTKSFNLTSGDGVRYVYFRVKDRAGNIGEPVSKPIILDTSPPDGSVLINNGELFTNDNSVILSHSGIDYLSNITGMSFSSDNLLWSDWEPFKEEKKFSLPNGDGKKKVYYRVQDGAGNIGLFTDTIILDTTPPHSLSIIINNGESEAKTTKITLKLNAIDVLSGVSQMSFCTPEGQWSSWEGFNNTKSYELSPENGQKIILFRVIDNAGNVAQPISGTINLNIETQKQDDRGKGTVSDYYLWVLLFIIIIILILLAVVMLRRKKKLKQDFEAKTGVTLEALTAKSGEALVSMPTTDKLTPMYKPPELPTATGTVTQIDEKQLTTQSDEPQHLPQPKQPPQLPPAVQQNQPQAQANVPGFTPGQQERNRDVDGSTIEQDK